MATIDDPLVKNGDSELFIGLVGPLGIDLDFLKDTLTDELAKVGYHTYEVRISDQIRRIKKYSLNSPEYEDDRIEYFMDAGTEIRKKVSQGEVLSLLSIQKLRELRKKRSGSVNTAATKTAYIFRSIKHPEEVQALRKIYGDLFILISAYSPKDSRVENLAKRISNSRGENDTQKYLPRAQELVQKDEDEEGTKLGQAVSDSFPLADFFVDIRDRQNATQKVNRFIEIVFGHPFYTPTQNEIGMYFAQSAALRSSDLSRQVGAAICSAKDDILSVGCNEVPSAGGGQYWPGPVDDRDFVRGFDSNAKYKDQIIKEVIEKFSSGGMLSSNLSDLPTEKILEYMMSGKGSEAIKGAQIFDLLEFGRAVHAEMAAITNAAKNGISIGESTLYSTTFPCHMCARHIVSSGILKVIYIEPYPKSKVNDLYRDSIAVDIPSGHPPRVEFQAFVGIAPRRFQEFFNIPSKRKEKDGRIKKWKPQNAIIRLTGRPELYMTLESKVIAYSKSIFSTKRIKLVK